MQIWFNGWINNWMKSKHQQLVDCTQDLLKDTLVVLSLLLEIFLQQLIPSFLSNLPLPLNHLLQIFKVFQFLRVKMLTFQIYQKLVLLQVLRKIHSVFLDNHRLKVYLEKIFKIHLTINLIKKLKIHC
jgi:hypothetical protein